MTIPPLSLGLSKGVDKSKLIDSELFSLGQAHGYLCKAGAHAPVHALSGRLQAGPNGGIELTVPASLIKGVFDALHEPGAEFVVRNNRTEAAIKVMTKTEVDKIGGPNKITERGHSYNYTLGPIVELPANGEYEKLWAISIDSQNLGDIRKSYGLETSPQLGFYIPVGIKKKNVTKENEVSKLASLLKKANELPKPAKPFGSNAAPSGGSGIMSGANINPRLNSSNVFTQAAKPDVQVGMPLVGGALPMQAATAMMNLFKGNRLMTGIRTAGGVAPAAPGVYEAGKVVYEAPAKIRDAALSAAGMKSQPQSAQQQNAQKDMGWSDIFSAVPNTKEVPFSVTSGDNKSILSTAALGFDLGKETLGHGLYKGLETFANAPSHLKNPLVSSPTAQLAMAASKPAINQVLPNFSRYANEPNYTNIYAEHLKKNIGGSTPAEAAKNLAGTPSPIDVKINPHYFKEVANTITPNVGEKAFDAVFGNAEQEANRNAMYNRMLELKNRGNSISQLGQPLSSAPVMSGTPWLKNVLSDYSSQAGKAISDTLIPPRPEGQKAPTMFPQVDRAIESLASNTAYTS